MAKVPDVGGETQGSIPAMTWLKLMLAVNLLPYRHYHTVCNCNASGALKTNTFNFYSWRSSKTQRRGL